MLYLQIGCAKDDHHLKEINTFSLIQVSLGCAGILGFIIVMKLDYRWRNKITKRQFQSFAIYAKDYTLEIKLSEKQTEYFDNYVYDKKGEKSYGE